jgi:hypothetical protein
MNNSPLRIVLRYLALYLLQIVIFKQMTTQVMGIYSAEIFVFPLFLAILPSRTPIQVGMLIGFFGGLFLDVAYDTLGVHAAAGVFCAFCMPWALRQVEPKGGFGSEITPSIQTLGLRPFVVYYAWVLFFYVFFYYCMLEFSPYYFIRILIKSVLTYTVSLFFGVILSTLFRSWGKVR